MAEMDQNMEKHAKMYILNIRFDYTCVNILNICIVLCYKRLMKESITAWHCLCNHYQFGYSTSGLLEEIEIEGYCSAKTPSVSSASQQFKETRTFVPGCNSSVLLSANYTVSVWTFSQYLKGSIIVKSIMILRTVSGVLTVRIFLAIMVQPVENMVSVLQTWMLCDATMTTINRSV